MKPFPDAGRSSWAEMCVLGSHPLKLPTTETDRAFGAQTLKMAPGLAIVRDEVRAHLVVHPVVAALVEEVEVVVGEKLGLATVVSGLIEVRWGCALVYRTSERSRTISV